MPNLINGCRVRLVPSLTGAELSSILCGHHPFFRFTYIQDLEDREDMFHAFSFDNDDEELAEHLGKMKLNTNPESDSSEWDIVVAIDIGTSFSGYAYSDKKEIKNYNINLNIWNANITVSRTSKAPTVVLLDENKEYHSFGYEAEENYAEHIENNTSTQKEYYRFRNFKMRLYHEKVNKV